ncbi:MAG: ROK family protein [Sulfolobales archaeon]
MSHNIVLSIDIGGTKIAYAFVDSEGGVHDYGIVKTERVGGRQVINQLREIIRSCRYRRIFGVGLSVPGIVRNGSVIWAPNIRGWRDVHLAELIRWDVPEGGLIEVVDDRTASALGELWQGAAKGLSNFVVLIIGTGVGAGIVIDGRPVHGSAGVSGAVGWWLLSRSLPHRSTRRGFLEEEIGGLALDRIARRYSSLRTSTGALLRELCEFIDSTCLFRAYDLGHDLAKNTLERKAVLLGILIANLLSLLNPEAIILSGSVGVELGKRFMPLIKRVVEAVAQPYATKSYRLEVSSLGHLSCLYGSAYLVLKRMGSIGK